MLNFIVVLLFSATSVPIGFDPSSTSWGRRHEQAVKALSSAKAKFFGELVAWKEIFS
jgi:hypothetical protein